MNKEDMVCLFSQAVKLKELGIRQKSLLYWGKIINQAGHSSTPLIEENTCLKLSQTIQEQGLPATFEYYSAYNVSELGELLAVTVTGDLPDGFKTTAFKEWLDLGSFLYKTEASMRASVLIYATENSII